LIHPSMPSPSTLSEVSHTSVFKPY
jgi:hypothetical protein